MQFELHLVFGADLRQTAATVRENVFAHVNESIEVGTAHYLGNLSLLFVLQQKLLFKSLHGGIFTRP